MPDSEASLGTMIKDQLRHVPRETFLFPQPNERRFLSETINSDKPLSIAQQTKLLKFAHHSDYVVAETSLDLLLHKGDKGEIIKQVSELEPLVNNADFHRRQKLALLMRGLDDTALPLLDRLLNDENPWVKRTATAALANKTFSEAQSRLMVLWNTERDEDERRMIVTTYANYNYPVVDEFLKQVAQSEGSTRAGTEAREILLRRTIEKNPNPTDLITSRVAQFPEDLALHELSVAICEMKEKGLQIINNLKAIIATNPNPRLKND